MNTDRGRILLAIARAAIAEQFGTHIPVGEASAWLQERGATFVTLTQNGRLRGCIGTLEARRSLLTDVQTNAQAAAFYDPRFAPLTPDELVKTDIEVSLLSAPQPLLFHTEQEALAQLRPNIDGVIFEYERYRSTFLPQVWEQLPNPIDFMAQLKHKAGLSPEFWNDGISLSRYTVTKWKEGDFKESAR